MADKILHTKKTDKQCQKLGVTCVETPNNYSTRLQGVTKTAIPNRSITSFSSQHCRLETNLQGMAGVASPALDGDQGAKFDILKEALYDEMQQHGTVERLYNQKDIFDLNIIPNDDLALLLRVVHGLCGEYLLVSTEHGRSGLAWRWRSSEDAKKCVNGPFSHRNKPNLLLGALSALAPSKGYVC